MRTNHSRHSREHIHAPRTLGERAADAVANGIGSWRFVGTQAVFTLLWIVANSLHGWGHVWDSYPYVLLNLCYSFQAGFTGPILLLASKRSAQIDRLRDDTEAVEVHYLARINRQQLALLLLWPALALAALAALLVRRESPGRK